MVIDSNGNYGFIFTSTERLGIDVGISGSVFVGGGDLPGYIKSNTVDGRINAGVISGGGYSASNGTGGVQGGLGLGIGAGSVGQSLGTVAVGPINGPSTPNSPPAKPPQPAPPTRVVPPAVNLTLPTYVDPKQIPGSAMRPPVNDNPGVHGAPQQLRLYRLSTLPILRRHRQLLRPVGRVWAKALMIVTLAVNLCERNNL